MKSKREAIRKSWSIPLFALLLTGCSGTTEPIRVASVVVGASQTAIPSGATLQLSASAKSADGKVIAGKNFTWSSANSAVANVSGAGLVTAGTVQGGSSESVNISATVDGITGSLLITVAPSPVATLSIIPATGTVGVGSTFQLTVTLFNSAGSQLSGRSINWTSSNTSVATVSTTGTVRALVPGTATITATSEGKSASSIITVPEPPALLANAIASSRDDSEAHTCGLNSSGTVYCWGGNSRGQLGDGTTTDRTKPTKTNTTIAFAQIVVGANHSCALTSSGSVYCWGRNDLGQLGDGTTVNKATPTRISGTIVFSSIAAGDFFTCGISSSGAAYCWGENQYGQIGDGTKVVSRPTPTPVIGGRTFISLATGWKHTCGIVTGGAAYCWGSNLNGQLGDNSLLERSSPTAVAGGITFTKLSVSTTHSCGISTPGPTYCWGGNTSGELGDGSKISKSVPTQVAGITTTPLVSVSAGWGFTCGITSTGAGYCWGNNSLGQLGQGSYSPAERLTPIAISGGKSFQSISAGGVYACGISSSSASLCWGDNLSGALGTGNFNNQLTPYPVSPP